MGKRIIYSLILLLCLTLQADAFGPFAVVGGAPAPAVASYPVVEATNIDFDNAPTGTTYTVDYGETPPDGDCLLIVIDGSWSSTNTTWNNGFTEIYDNATNPRCAAAYKVASSEGTSMTLKGNAGSTVSAIYYRISGAACASITATVTAAGSGTAPDPPSHDMGSSDNYLWIAVACLVSSGGDLTAWPSGYTGANLETTSLSTINVIGSDYRTNAAQTENPGTFTCSTGDDPWDAVTIGVPPS